MKWTRCLLFLFLVACHRKGPACPVTVAAISSHAPRPMVKLTGPNHQVSSLFDNGWDSVQGGAFLFYPNGNLRSYSFYQKDRRLVYTEVYDETGVLLHTQGSPMVDRVITQVGEDSAFVRIYFFSLGKQFRDLQVRINDRPPLHFAMRPDSVYANLDRVSFGLNISGLKKLNMYSQIGYLDECTQVDHLLSDSIFLVRNPDLSPANP